MTIATALKQEGYSSNSFLFLGLFSYSQHIQFALRQMVIRWQIIWTWKQEEFLWVVPLKLGGVWGHQDDVGRQDKQISIAGCSLPNEAIWKITSVLLNPKHTGLTARLLSNQCVYSEKLIISFLQREAWDISLSQLSKARPAFKGLQVRCQYCKLSSRVFSYSALLKGSGASDNMPVLDLIFSITTFLFLLTGKRAWNRRFRRTDGKIPH